MSNFSQPLVRSSAFVAPLQIQKSQECLAIHGATASSPGSELLQSTHHAIARTMTEMTPPPTPLRLLEHPGSDETEEDIQPDFHNFLRAFYPFHPNSTASSSTVTLPLNEGDVILVHSIHTNGWADGTLLTSGARGWLPTNYCEAYDPQAMRNLLKSLLNFWDLLRGDLSETMHCFTNQEYMRGIIAGVRCLLDDCRCLTRDAHLVTSDSSVRRNRKGLLSELSALVRTARRLQDEAENAVPTNLMEDTIYEITLKAFKVVTRAVRFLDVWGDANAHRAVVSKNQKDQHPAAVGGMAHPNQQSLSKRLDGPPTPPAEATTFGQAISMDVQVVHMVDAGNTFPAAARSINETTPNDKQLYVVSPTLNGPPAPVHAVDHQLEQTTKGRDAAPTGWPAPPNTSTCPPPAFHRPALRRPSNSSQPSPSFPRRPLSSQQRNRQSTTHRISASGHATAACKANLASQRLSAAHDNFLSHQGSFIGRLHLQSRSMSELLLTTQQSVTACRDLLTIVEEVWDRDLRRSDSLEEAKDIMYTRITELVQTTREIFHSTVSRDEGEDVVNPENDRELMSAATDCVKAAGECVAQTKFVLERIGDFEFEPFGLGIVEGVEDAPSSQVSTEPTTPRVVDTVPADVAIQFPQPPTSPVTPTPTPLTVTTRWPPSPSRFNHVFADLPPSPASPFLTVIETFPTPSSDLTSQFPQPPSSQSAMVDEHQPTVDMGLGNSRPEVTSALSSLTVKRDATPSVVDVNASSAVLTPLPDSPTDSHFSMASTSMPPPQGIPSSWVCSGGDSWPREPDTASIGANSTSYNVLRDSETSVMSQTSTRATTPELIDSKRSDGSLNQGFLSTSGSQTTLSSSCEDAEASLLEKTFAHELIYNKTGQITGGTLPALIERITTHNSTPDSTFVSTFYLTFRLFTTPVQFAEALVDRFRYVGEGSHVAGPVRLRVYNVFKGWMESHWRPECDNCALPTILDFASGELKLVLPAAATRLAALGEKVSSAGGPLVPRLVSSIGKTNTSIAPYIPPDTPLPAPILSKSQLNALKSWKVGGAKLSILDFDPMELARQFTIKESQIFCSIMPEELLAMEWTKKSGSKAVNVRAMSTLSTDLATLVADTILNLDAKKRAAIIKQWVKIAKKSLALNNYDSLMAIICALNSSTILRLKKTWDMVSPKTKATLEELRAIVEVTRNYAVLRQRLQNHVPPCLPFVGTYLTDLTFIEAGNQQMRHLSGAGGGSGGCGDPGKAVINFDKHQKTAKVIGELQRFQIPYRLTVVPELQEWMDTEILRVRESAEASLQSYYRRSLLLEPREGATTRSSPTESNHSSFSGSSLRNNFDTFLPWTTRDKSIATSI